MTRKRAYCFTINNYTDADIVACIDLAFSAVYFVCAFEIAPNTGTPHIQGYVYFENAREFCAVTNFISRAHVIPAKGTSMDNYMYIVGPYEKDGKTKPLNPDHWEYGEIPHQGHAKWALIKSVMKDPRENPHLFMQYRKSYRCMNNILSTGVVKPRVFNCISYDDYDANYDNVRLEHPDYSVCGLSCDYDGEDIVFMSLELELNEVKFSRKIIDWKLGRTVKERIGFEWYLFDPSIVFLVIDKFHLTHSSVLTGLAPYFDNDFDIDNYNLGD